MYFCTSSGAQMNPAVSFGLFLSGAQAFDVTVGYFLSQLFGATAGAGITRVTIILAFNTNVATY